MLKSPLLFSISFLVTLLSWTSTVKAEDAASFALNFALPPAEEPVEAQGKRSSENELAVEGDRTIDDLSRPQESLRAISSVTNVTSVSDAIPSDQAAHTSEREQVGSSTDSSSADSSSTGNRKIGIHFLKDSLELPQETSDESPLEVPNKVPMDASLEQTAQTSYNQPLEEADIEKTDIEKTDIEETYEVSGLDDWIFEGGSRSLVAHTVGSAEGTRRWNGDRTKAYHGHVDPGNGVWNLGTFSYQHGASSPEEADTKQLKRLKLQGIQLEQKASQKGIQLSLQEKLNGLDLANQAPIAALGKGGYIDRLAQAYRLQLSGEEAIAWARTRSYIDPDTKKWNAPGLGNNLYSISKDQERRMAAINQALRAYNQADHDSLELAKLERIQLEGSELEGVGLSRRTVAETSFDGVAEEFKLAAHDISLEEIESRVEPEEALAAAAISFDLPNAPTASTVATNELESQAALPNRAQATRAPEAVDKNVLDESILSESSLNAEQLDSETLDSVATALPSDLPDQLLNEVGDISLTFASDSISEETSTEVPVADVEAADIQTADAAIANAKATEAEVVSTETETDISVSDISEVNSSEPITFEPAETMLAEEIAAERIASTAPSFKNPTAQGSVAESQASDEQMNEGKQTPTLASLLDGTSNQENENAPTLSSLFESLLSDGDTASTAASSLLRTEDKIVQPSTNSQ